jgi:hypothetical protein
LKKAGGGSFGGTELRFVAQSKGNHCRLLIDVLTGLGGASQEHQQPALVLSNEKALAKSPALSCVRQMLLAALCDPATRGNNDKLKFVGHFTC